jgi:hypothetical protein
VVDSGLVGAAVASSKVIAGIGVAPPGLASYTRYPGLTAWANSCRASPPRHAKTARVGDPGSGAGGSLAKNLDGWGFLGKSLARGCYIATRSNCKRDNARWSMWSNVA